MSRKIIKTSFTHLHTLFSTHLASRDAQDIAHGGDDDGHVTLGHGEPVRRDQGGDVGEQRLRQRGEELAGEQNNVGYGVGGCGEVSDGWLEQ